MEILNFKGPLSDLIYILKKGGSIHIKKKNRGKFTESAKRAGMGVQEYARHVLANKDKYSSTLVKRANFARNAKKFKHEDGGVLFAQNGTGNWWMPQPLSPVGIALNQAKTMTKMKGEQQYLPPGVKEVIGSDGKKVAIRTEQPLQPLEQNIAEWLPGTGDVAEAGYIANDIKNGNLGSAALTAGLTFIPGNWRKVLDTLTPSKKDKFLDFFSKEIGKTVKRVPVTKNDLLGVYSDGFRYLDESGKEIAHIAGSKKGNRVFVESSFMDPEFRSRGIGKQMYFDFNDQMFNKYGKTIGSDSGQHMMTLETSPGIFISPSGRMWRGLRNKGLATTENPPIVSYIMAEPKIIKPYKKYSKGGKL